MNRDKDEEREHVVQIFGRRRCYEEITGTKAPVEDLPELDGGNMWRPA